MVNGEPETTITLEEITPTRIVPSTPGGVISGRDRGRVIPGRRRGVFRGSGAAFAARQRTLRAAEETKLRQGFSAGLRVERQIALDQLRKEFEAKISRLPDRDARLQAQRDFVAQSKAISQRTQQSISQVKGLELTALRALRQPKAEELKQQVEGIRTDVRGTVREGASDERFRILSRDDRGEIKLDIGGAVRRFGGRAVGKIETGITDPVEDFLISQGLLKEKDSFLFKGRFDPGDVAIAFALEPVFLFGAAKSGVKQTAKAVVKKKVTKKKLSKKEVEETIRAVRDFFTTAGKTAQLQKAREVVNLLKNKPKDFAKTKRFFDNAIGKEASDKLFADALAQEGFRAVRGAIKPVRVSGVKGGAGAIPGAISTVSILSPTKARAEARIIEQQRVSDLPSIVGGAGQARGEFTGLGQFEKTAEVAALVRPNRTIGQGASKISIERTRINERLSDLKSQLSRQGVSELQANKQVSALRQQLSQQTQNRLAQDSAIRLRQRSRLGQALASTQAQRQRFRQRQRLRTPGEFARPRLRPRTRVPLLPPFLRGARPFAAKERFKKLPNKFDVFVRRRGKQVRITKKPLRRKPALDFGAHRVDTTLRASFLLRPSNRKGLGKISKSIRGAFGRNRRELRPAKSLALRGAFVEKRKFRLDSRSEVKRIQQLKRAAKPFKKRR